MILPAPIRIAPLALLAVLSCGESSPPAAKAQPGQPPARESSPKPAAANSAPSRTLDPPKPAPGGVTRMPLGTLFQLQQAGTVLIYDVRPGFIYRLGHIPGAVSWPKSSYDTQLAARSAEMTAATAAGRPVVLYCTDLACPDARDVAGRLSRAGFTISVLEGGWDAWRVGELPVE